MPDRFTAEQRAAIDEALQGAPRFTADQQAAIDDAMQREEAEQQRRADMSLPERVVDAEGRASRGLREAAQPVLRRLRDFNTGLLDVIPGGRSLLGGVIGREPGDDPEGIAGRGSQVAGQAVGLAGAGVGALGARTAAAGPQVMQQLTRQPGVRGGAERIGQDMLQTAARRPGLTATAEVGGGFGAGAGGEIARRASPDAELAGQVVGGLAGAVAPGAAAASLPRAGRRLTETFAPFTEAGGRLRAAKQMQARAEDPQAAARAVADAPEGVSPARSTGDARLMAQERRILDDHPELDMQFRDDLVRATRAAREDLMDAAGRQRPPDEWRQRVIESVAAPGAEVPAGVPSDEALDIAFRSFDPLYAQARGIDITPAIQLSDTARIPLRGAIRASVRDPNIFASRAERRRTEAWLDNQLTSVMDRAGPGGQVDSGDLLTLRSRVRDLIRRRRGDDRVAERELLSSAEKRITETLESQLPPETAQVLRDADAQFGRFKIVEDAVFRAGDRELTPQRVSDSLRRAARSPGRFARGHESRDLRQAALSGRDPATFIGQPPDTVRRTMRDADPQTREVLQGGFIDALRRRSETPRITEDGVQAISGARFDRLIRDNEGVMRALGMSDGQLNRMKRISGTLRTVEEKSPAAVAQLFEDGPGTLLELGAALVGAKTGQRVAGQGLGSSLVMAQFFSGRMRQVLANFTSDKATELMIRAQTDPELFRALLVGPTTSTRRQDDAAQIIGAWMGTPAFVREFEGGEGEP